ncbi:MAG TPA: AAA family ATPase [Gaiellales bacterium]|nr:AAA family ATPase [Gaiellales bacterium]
MTGSVRVLVVLDPSVTGEQVMPSVPVDDVNVVGTIDDPREMLRALERTRADLLLLACDHGSDGIVQLIGEATRQRPGRPVLVLCAGAPNGFVRQVFDAGADDIVELPQSRESVRFLIEKAIARRQPSERAPARTVVVLGPKGGTGKTLTACNLGVLLANAGHRTVLVDIDLQFGDVGLSLGLRPDRTIYDLATSGGTMDATKVSDYLTRHSSGLEVLIGPARPDQAATVTVPMLLELYAILGTEFDYVVVDTPPGFTPEVIASIDLSTDLCVVGTLDTLSLKNTRLGLETLSMMGYPEQQVSLVLNRAQTKVGITGEDVEAIVGRTPDVFIPSDRNIPRSVNEGSPISVSEPKSDAAKAFVALTDRYLPDREAPVAPSRRRLLARKA